MRVVELDKLELKERLKETRQWKEEAEAEGNTEIAIRADGANSIFVELLLRVKHLPIIDLVMCRECKHWTPDWIDALAESETGICAKSVKQTWDCDYCSKAERKDNG